MFKLLRRADDVKFIESLFDRCVSIIIIPHKNKLIAWCREPVQHSKVVEVKQMRNKLWLIKASLSL